MKSFPTFCALFARFSSLSPSLFQWLMLLLELLKLLYKLLKTLKKS